MKNLLYLKKMNFFLTDIQGRRTKEIIHKIIMWNKNFRREQQDIIIIQ